MTSVPNSAFFRFRNLVACDGAIRTLSHLGFDRKRPSQLGNGYLCEEKFTSAAAVL